MKKFISVLIALLLIGIIIGVAFGPKIIDKYSYSKEMADMDEYFDIENAAVGENDLPARIVNKFHSLGYVVEMDDFGSGYSSLDMLSSMKIDILKLDINFVRNETEKMLNNSILSGRIS